MLILVSYGSMPIPNLCVGFLALCLQDLIFKLDNLDHERERPVGIIISSAIASNSMRNRILPVRIVSRLPQAIQKIC